jgi:hypothetical protein
MPAGLLQSTTPEPLLDAALRLSEERGPGAQPIRDPHRAFPLTRLARRV